MPRIQDSRVWVPKRTVGETWFAVVKCLPISDKIEEEVLKEIFTAHPVKPLIEKLSLKAPNMATVWEGCSDVLEIVGRFWTECRLTVRADFSKNEQIAAKLEDYYGGNERYFFHDYLDIEKLTRGARSSPKVINEPDWWVLQHDWVHTFTSFLNQNYIFDLPLTADTSLYDLVAPHEDLAVDKELTATVRLFNAYLPVHSLQVLRSIGVKWNEPLSLDRLG